MLLPWQKPKELPTLLHITHIKAGSTWIDGLLRRLFGDRVMPRFGSNLFDPATSAKDGSPEPPPYLELFRAMEYQPGHVYPGLFITHREFVTRLEFRDARRFVVIRDLRDTLTSHYFSLKGTHALDKLGRVKTARDFLQSASKEDGFLFLIERDLERLIEIQRSWLAAGELVVRYEDLIRDDLAGFRRLFLEKLELPLSERKLARAVEASRFETVYKRKLGQLDEKSHARQGLPGDWKNHFPPAVCREFNRRAGDLLIAAGYEANDRWIETPVPS